MLTRDQAIAEIRAARCDPERLATLALPDDQDVRRYLFDVCPIETLAQTLFERTKDEAHWPRFQIEVFALGGMVLASKDMCDWVRTRHDWTLRPGWAAIEIWEKETEGEDWAEEHYAAPRKALEAKEKWLDGEIGVTELIEARQCAYDATVVSAKRVVYHDIASASAESSYSASYAHTGFIAHTVYYVACAAAYAVYDARVRERDRWYLDYLGYLLETCNKELLR